MKKIVTACALLIAANAFAVRLEFATPVKLAPVESLEKAKVLRESLRAFLLPDGSLWGTTFVRGGPEASAISVTRVARDGAATSFFLSDWLPKGSMPEGWRGQVDEVTQLDDGRIAISGGWNDGRDSHNAVLILRARTDGRYDTDKIIRLPGVDAIAAAPGNTVVAVTTDAMRRDAPLLTLLDADGKKRGLIAGRASLSPLEAAQNAGNARLQRIGAKGVAFYEAGEQVVHLLELDASRRDEVVTGRRVIPVGDDRELAALPVAGIDVAEDGDVLVARVGRLRDMIGTFVSIYGRDGKLKETVPIDRPWSLMLHEKGKIHGVVRHREVGLDTVSLTSGK